MKNKLVLGLTFILGLVAHSTALTVVQNTSTIAISGSGQYTSPAGLVTDSYNTSVPAPGVLTDAIIMPVHAGPFPTTTFSGSSASQSSLIAGGHIEAAGGASTFANRATEELQFQSYGSASFASSVFDFVFIISEPTTYHLSGFLDRQSFGPDQSTFRLLPLGGSPLVDVMFGPSTFFSFDSHEDFDLTGLLNPGTYQLTASAFAASGGSRHESDTGSAGFSFTADFATVPESGGTWLLLSATLAALAWCKRRFRPN